MPKNVAKHVKNMSKTAITNRVRRMLDIRDEYLKDVENTHVKVQKGNTKTGMNCFTVSLIPIADCPGKCMKKGGCGLTGCYDIQNVCFQPMVQNDRARNSAIHLADPERYWREIGDWIEVLDIRELRLNVGGDLTDADFYYVKKLAEDHPGADILFFTKNDDGLNKFLDDTDFPANVHYLVSCWPNMVTNNPHNVPESHIIWEDGSTTLPKGVHKKYVSYCGGNCSECSAHNTGCWALNRSTTEYRKQYQVLFAH